MLCARSAVVSILLTPYPPSGPPAEASCCQWKEITLHIAQQREGRRGGCKKEFTLLSLCLSRSLGAATGFDTLSD